MTAKCRRFTSIFLAALVTWFGLDAARAAEPKRLVLWPDGAPGAKGEEPHDVPTLTVHRPLQASSTAIVVCPGGGYGGLALDHEGQQIADWLTGHGITAVVLRYRHAPHYGHPAPLDDAQRAVRTVRARSEAWGIDPDRIGMIGFSAGGHLVSSAGTHFDDGAADATDPIARVRSRPDFLLLVYPVIALDGDFAHRGSRRNLLGDNPSKELVELMSSQRQATDQTPPAFLVHSTADKAVPPENSLMFYRALRRAGVPAEMHIYERGPHGFGLGGDDPALSTWPALAMSWMTAHGLYEPPAGDE